MKKLTTIVVLLLLTLAGCHCQRKTAQASANAPKQQTVVETAAAVPPAQNAPTPQETHEVVLSASQASQIKTASAAPFPTPNTPKSTLSHQVATPPVSTANTPTAKGEPAAFVPALFTPTFKGEEVISTQGRMLHPYAALIPQNNIPQTAPWAYEQLKYGIYYSFVKAGTAYIHNRGLVNIHGRNAYLLQTTAFSASVIDAVFKVRDINQSWLDASQLYSHGYGQSVREGTYRRDEWLTFDYPAKKYFGKIQKKAAPKNISGPLEIKVLDMLSALYYVRAQELEIGKPISFDIVNREKQYPLLVKVLKKETVKTPAGKFKCIVVEPQFRGEGIFVAKGKSLKVWLTDDEYKMPVKMAVEVFIGSVSAELLAYQRQAPENFL